MKLDYEKICFKCGIEIHLHSLFNKKVGEKCVRFALAHPT